MKIIIKNRAALILLFIAASCAPVELLCQARDSRNAQIYYNDALKRNFKGHWRLAIQQLNRALSYDSLFVPAHIFRQDLLSEWGKEDSLRAYYSDLKNRYPGSVLYYFLWGRMLENREEAKRIFDMSIQMDSLFYWGYTGRGNYYMRRNMYHLAAEDFQKAIAINPARINAQSALGLAYVKLEKTGLAEKQFRKILLINPETVPDAYYNLGLISLARGDSIETVSNFEKLLEIINSGPEYDRAIGILDSFRIKNLPSRDGIKD